MPNNAGKYVHAILYVPAGGSGKSIQARGMFVHSDHKLSEILSIAVLFSVIAIIISYAVSNDILLKYPSLGNYPKKTIEQINVIRKENTPEYMSGLVQEKVNTLILGPLSSVSPASSEIYSSFFELPFITFL